MIVENDRKEHGITRWKNMFNYTRNLSDETFYQLQPQERQLLMIQWSSTSSFHDSLIRADLVNEGISEVNSRNGTNGNSKAPYIKASLNQKKQQKQTPPPNVFAKYDDYKKNLECISEWWTLPNAKQKEIKIEYENLLGGAKARFQNNVKKMLFQQENLYREKKNLAPIDEQTFLSNDVDTTIETESCKSTECSLALNWEEKGINNPDAIYLADAYNNALDNQKHGNKIALPKRLHKLVSKQQKILDRLEDI